MTYAHDSLFAKIIGPCSTVAAVRALGGDYRQWVDNFQDKEPTRYATDGGGPFAAVNRNYWANANYYDRALIYYQWHAATGDEEYLRKAHELALNYRKFYAPGGDVSAHWNMNKGVCLHYLLTDDEESRDWVVNVGTTMSAPYYMDSLDSNDGTDNRQQARCIESFLCAYLLTDDGAWKRLLDEAIPKILRTQAEDGAYRFEGTQKGGCKPFMTGLLNDAFALYWHTIDQDERLPPAITKACDYLWSACWVPSAKAFKYQEVENIADDAPDDPAPDVNMLIVNGFAYAGKHAEALQIIEGSMSAWLDGSKQFNQQYADGYRGIALLTGAQSAWEGGGGTPPIDPDPGEDVDVAGAIADLEAAQTLIDQALGKLGAA